MLVYTTILIYYFTHLLNVVATMYSKWYEITLQQFLSDRCTEVISCQIERFFQSEKSSDKMSCWKK